MRKPIVVLVVIATALACGGQLSRPTRTQLTSGRIPRPDATATASRTIDSTGFVDNAGLTTDNRGRTETSGMRATETGSERPTGTPGSGAAVPAVAPESGPGRERPAPLVTQDLPGLGSGTEEQIARFAQARCDWENACGHIGEGKRHESNEACAQNVRPIIRRELSALDCAQGFDPVHAGLCLSALRGATCANDNDVFRTNENCRPSLVCSL